MEGHWEVYKKLGLWSDPAEIFLCKTQGIAAKRKEATGGIVRYAPRFGNENAVGSE